MSINSAIVDYERSGRRMNVDHAINATRKQLGWKMADKYKHLLLRLFNWLERFSPPPIPDVPGGVSRVISGATIQSISRLARFVALNADAFQNVPPPNLLSQCFNRKWVLDNNPAKEEACGTTFQFAKIIGKCEQNKLDTVRKAVEDVVSLVRETAATFTRTSIAMNNRWQPSG